MGEKKFPLLLTMGDLDLELLLKQFAVHGNTHTSDKEFVHELCSEIHLRRQKKKWVSTPLERLPDA